MDFNELKINIDSKRGDDLELGNTACAPSDDCIKETENKLGFNLPKSYIWFLKNYGSATLFGEEIYSIYCKKEDNIHLVGDLVTNYYLNLNQSLIDKNELPIYTDEFGQMYVMDTTTNEEYPIFIKFSESGEKKRFYANNFLSFLEKQLLDIE